MERPGNYAAREQDYTARGWWSEGDTLAKWLSAHSRKRGMAPALAHDGKTWSWKELEKEVLAAAQGLLERGVGKGDVVAVQLPNTPEFVISHLAICRLGGIMSTLHMPYRGAEI